jgi:hypothetical protein
MMWRERGLRLLALPGELGPVGVALVGPLTDAPATVAAGGDCHLNSAGAAAHHDQHTLRAHPP